MRNKNSELSKLFKRDESLRNGIPMIGFVVFLMLTIFQLIEILFGLFLYKEVTYEEVRYIFLFIRNYILLFTFIVFLTYIAKKEHFNNKSLIITTFILSICDAILLYFEGITSLGYFVFEWIITTIVIFCLVKMVFKYITKKLPV